MFWKYVLWISCTLVYNFFVCFASVKLNGKSFFGNYLAMLFCGLIPTWSLVAYFSKNLIFDGLLFDMILVISSVIFFSLLGKAHNFTFYNWIGVTMAVIGLILARG